MTGHSSSDATSSLDPSLRTESTAQEEARAAHITLAAVGGTIINRGNPQSAVSLTAEAIGQMDLSFCQLDTNLSARGCRQVHALSPQRSSPETAATLRLFDVASFASNHCLDWGIEAFEDTLELLRASGVAPVGAGRNLAEARLPVFLEAKGVRVAFLARNSILPSGYAASDQRPGCAPLLAHSAYVAVEPDQPGTPCRTYSFVDPLHLNALRADVMAAKARADIVFLSLHAGIHVQPVVLADYQREAAHAAIDAGADIVFQHHGHILKGIEFYKGRPVIYSMGNYVMDIHIPIEEWHNSPALKELVDTYGIPVDEFEAGSYATYPFAPDARKTAIAKFEVTHGRLSGTYFLPVYIRPDSTPEVLSRHHPRAQEVADYMVFVTEEAGLNARFEWEGDEIRVYEG